MLLSTRIKFALVLWFALEALLFVLIVKLVGVGGAIVLGLLSSLLGLSTLRRAGASAMAKMRQAVSGRGRGVAMQDETLATFGAFALLLPGFLSDIVGLVLIVPSLRVLVWRGMLAGGFVSVARSSARPAAPHGPTTIDLDPQDWRHVEGTPRSMPRA